MISYGQTRDGRRHPCEQPIAQPKEPKGVKAPISPTAVTGESAARRGRAVIVNGLMYGSVGDAAAVHGFSVSALKWALAHGGTCKGATVRYADERDR